MSADVPHVRGELPWLRSGPLFRVERNARPALDLFLANRGYLCVDVDGRAMTSLPAAHAELARAFGFPSHYGANWDAFRDCMSDFAEENAGRLVAVLWEHLGAIPAATCAEVGWALLATAAEPGGVRAFDVFAIGEGPEVDSP